MCKSVPQKHQDDPKRDHSAQDFEYPQCPAVQVAHEELHAYVPAKALTIGNTEKGKGHHDDLDDVDVSPQGIIEELARDNLGNGEHHQEHDEKGCHQVENIFDAAEPAVSCLERRGKRHLVAGVRCFHQGISMRNRIAPGPRWARRDVAP